MSAIVPIIVGLCAFALAILIMTVRAERRVRQQLADQQRQEGENRW
jgi:hypothetical protein